MRASASAASNKAEQSRKAGFDVLLYDQPAEVFIDIGISSDSKANGWKKKLLDAVVVAPK
jgi:hypothetical protein